MATGTFPGCVLPARHPSEVGTAPVGEAAAAGRARANHPSDEALDMTQLKQEEMLAAEVRYRHERLDLYRARVYSGRPTSPQRLRALQQAYDGAVSRLRRCNPTANHPARP